MLSETAYLNALEVMRDILAYFESLMGILPTAPEGSFRKRNPYALRDRLKVALAAMEASDGKETQRPLS